MAVDVEIERRLTQIESTLPHLATKADLHALEVRLAVRLIVAMAALGGVIIAVDRLWT